MKPTTEHTTKAAQALAMAVQDLRGAVHTASAVESLELFHLIEAAATLAHRAEALSSAMEQDEATKTTQGEA
jgi:hypothetical protein